MNILIKNALVLTMADNDRIWEDASIAIEGQFIKHVGEVPNDFKADKVIDAKNKLVLPGLVNSHTHIAMSLFRNYADDLPLWPWLTEKIWPLEAKLSEEDVYWGSMLSVAEMIRSGITCFADMYFFMDETAKSVEESGMRASLSRGMSGDGDTAQKFKEVREFFNNWHRKADGRINVLVGPHAPYTCPPEFLYKTIELAKDLNTGIHIHLSETKKEVDDSFNDYGKSPIKHVYDLGLFELPTLAAHCVHVSDDDIDILAENNVSVANNPGSNLKLGSGFAPVEKMLRKGVNIGLGTDGSSSNNNLNMFEEINLAAIVNKAVNLDTTVVPAITALKMATINGAKAIGLENEIGTIEAGKKADVILIDLNKPHFYPRYNLVSSLTYSAQASDVDTVIIDGKIVMENYEIKTINLEKILYNAERSAKNLIK